MKIKTITACCFLITCILATSCSSNEKFKSITKHYPSGKLKSIGTYYLDSIPVGPICTYLENGNISSIEVFDSTGKLNGTSLAYYNNGKLYQSIPNKNGYTEGFVETYNPSGLIKGRAFFHNDVQIGDAFGYYPSGSYKYYNFFDFDNNNLVVIEYDLNGKTLKDDRKVIFVDSIKLNDDTIINENKRIHDLFAIISNPPHSNTTLVVTYLSDNNSIIRKDSIKDQHFYSVKNVLPDSLNQIHFFAIQFDSVTRKFNYQRDVIKILYGE